MLKSYLSFMHLLSYVWGSERAWRKVWMRETWSFPKPWKLNSLAPVVFRSPLLDHFGVVLQAFFSTQVAQEPCQGSESM